MKVQSVDVLRLGNQTDIREADLLAVEEPLEIRLHFGPEDSRTEKRLAVTMRTPGNDFELAVGFLFTEGVVNGYDDISIIRYCETIKTPEEKDNVVIVELGPQIVPALQSVDRNFYMSSSCGVCGKSSIESIKIAGNNLSNLPIQVNSSVVMGLHPMLLQEQSVFKHTGGLHASGLFDLDGSLLLLREDVGRHNALDKLIGSSLVEGTDLNSRILLVSGRLSYELVQKSIRAGIPIVVAIGAPSSLAVNLAREFNLTLIGFLKDDKFNVYAGEERIIK